MRNRARSPQFLIAAIKGLSSRIWRLEYQLLVIFAFEFSAPEESLIEQTGKICLFEKKGSTLLLLEKGGKKGFGFLGASRPADRTNIDVSAAARIETRL